MKRIAIILMIVILTIIVPVAALAHDGWLLCHFVLDDVTGRVTLDCEPYTPPVPPTPEPTATPPTPEPTAVPPTPVPTATPAPPVQPNQYWHAPGAHDGLNVHEHGDAPPQWADDWSMATFGHAVMYGGDEASSPMENTHKHQVYKGFSLRSGNGVDLYVRYHAGSNPLDRAAALHSYEVYARDAAGGISFWQGLEFYGWPDIPEHRVGRLQEQPNSLYPGWRGATGGQFVLSPTKADIAANLNCEQWYGLTDDGWGWSFGITICGSTTLRPDQPGAEPGDPMDTATWQTTNERGLNRRLEVSFFGPKNPVVGVSPVVYGAWYCVVKYPQEPAHTYNNEPIWGRNRPVVAGPNDCPAGYLPQYIASTFPAGGVWFQVGNVANKTHPGPGVTLPN